MIERGAKLIQRRIEPQIFRGIVVIDTAKKVPASRLLVSERPHILGRVQLIDQFPRSNYYNRKQEDSIPNEPFDTRSEVIRVANGWDNAFWPKIRTPKGQEPQWVVPASSESPEKYGATWGTKDGHTWTIFMHGNTLVVDSHATTNLISRLYLITHESPDGLVRSATIEAPINPKYEHVSSVSAKEEKKNDTDVTYFGKNSKESILLASEMLDDFEKLRDVVRVTNEVTSREKVVFDSNKKK